MTPERARRFWYIPPLILAMGLMLGRTLLMARLLSVEGFGEFSAGLLISSTFCMLACLGLQPMLQRDLPVLLIRLRAFRGAILLAQCIIVACSCALLAVLAALAGPPMAGMSIGVMVFGLVHGLSQQLFLIATVESRSRGQPTRFALQNLLRGLLVLGAGSSCAYAFDSALTVLLAEALVSFAITQVTLQAIFRSAAVKAGTVYRLAVRRLGRVRWRSAFVLLLVTASGFVLTSADRWVAAHMLSTDLFGQYAFAWTLLMIAQSVQVVANASVFPMLARRFAVTGRGGVYRVSAKISIALLLAGLVLAVPAVWLAHLAISHWFKAFAPSLQLIPLFIMIGVLRVSDFWSSFMVIVGLERRLLTLNIAAGVIAFGAWSLWTSSTGNRDNALLQVGALGAMLTLLNYALVAASAWAARNR